MNECPKCGHQWPDDKRAKGGKARWRGMNKKARSSAAAKAAKARWAKSGNGALCEGGTQSAELKP